ncbi:RhuM family protein [Legionella sp.]
MVYRINSLQATKFRIWATKILHNHIIKGYTLNQNQLCVKIR